MRAKPCNRPDDMVLYLLAVVWREGFRFLFNAQFFGADVASLLPQQLTVGSFLGTLLALRDHRVILTRHRVTWQRSYGLRN